MKISPRETTLAVVTLSVLLYGGTLLVAKQPMTKWKELRSERASVARTIEADRRLVAQQDEWAGRLAGLSRALPKHPAGQKVDVYWLSMIDKLAKKHNIEMRRLEAGAERPLGDVFELPITCNDWEGTLDALVRFLFDLQAEGAMLDIRQLVVKPKGKSLLRGRFSIYCAYTRDAGDQPKP